jgi:ABC-type sugar transport system ATPase subunit
MSATGASSAADLADGCDGGHAGPGVPLLSGRALSKSYGPTRALAGVDLDLAAGDWLAVLGENGAGKSTLSRIIAGSVVPDAGELRIAGRTVRFSSPRAALRAGVVMIPQEISCLPDLSVAENICLGDWPRRYGVVSRRSMTSSAAEQLERLGAPIDPGRPMSELRLADRQLVEIARALARRARVLVLDEPTAALSAQDAARLFLVLEQSVAAGIALVYISHRLDEIFAHANRVLVLRDGQVVLDAPVRMHLPAEVVSAMLGRELAARRSDATKPARGPVRLEYRRDAATAGRSELALEVSSGEIVGLYGLRGAGCDEVIEEIAGARTGRGTVRVDGGAPMRWRSPRSAIRRGVVYVPAERKSQGLVVGGSIKDNLMLVARRAVARFGVIQRRRESELAVRYLELLHVRAVSASQVAGELSGGNQQKVLLASRLCAEPKVLLLHEPTRGVDVGARSELQAVITEMAREGVAVLLVTSDVAEAVEVCDRLLVMFDGQLVADLAGADKTEVAALGIAAGSDRHSHLGAVAP